MTFFLFIFLSFFFLLPKTYIKIREIYTRNRTTIRVWDDFTIYGETYKSRNDAENIGQNNRCWSHKSRETDVTVDSTSEYRDALSNVIFLAQFPTNANTCKPVLRPSIEM